MRYQSGPKFRRSAIAAAASAFVSISLVGCGNEAQLDPDRVQTGLDGVAGRLALVEHNGDRLHIMNVAARDDGHDGDHGHDGEHGRWLSDDDGCDEGGGDYQQQGGDHESSNSFSLLSTPTPILRVRWFVRFSKAIFDE